MKRYVYQQCPFFTRSRVICGLKCSSLTIRKAVAILLLDESLDNLQSVYAGDHRVPITLISPFLTALKKGMSSIVLKLFIP